MSGQREIKCTAQGVDVRARVGSRAARVLLEWCVPWRSLVANEKERACAILHRLRIAQVDQHGRAIGRNTDVVRLDVSMNNRWMVVMQECHRVAH